MTVVKMHEPLAKMRFSKFPMKFANRCLTCGTALPEGAKAYGTKIDGKWKFLCPKCYNDLMSMADGESTVPEDFESEGVEVEDLDPEFMEKLSMAVNEDGEPEPVELFDPETTPKPKKSVMQLIEENARWRV